MAITFGEVTDGASIAAQVGLSASVLGLGLAIIRAASLASLPLSGLADRLGRRQTIIWYTAAGLGLTVLAAASPSYWVFVAIFAFGRPLLSSTTAIGGVIAAEETRAADRSKAIALVTAAYAAGAGLVAVARVPLADYSFRAVLLLALLPLAALPLLARYVVEPDRFATARPDRARRPRLGSVPSPLRRRLALVAGLTLALNVVTGPVNTFLFVYAEGVLAASTDQTALAVVLAGPAGLAGLLVGRWSADRWGRRATALTGQVLVAGAGILTYSGSLPRLLAGYLLTITAGGAYAPAMGALSAELFPTRVRATAAGWLQASGVVGAVIGLMAFGFASDRIGSFTGGALLLGIPVALTAGLFLLLPETRGLELEDSAPDDTEEAGGAHEAPGTHGAPEADGTQDDGRADGA